MFGQKITLKTLLSVSGGLIAIIGVFITLGIKVSTVNNAVAAIPQIQTNAIQHEREDAKVQKEQNDGNAKTQATLARLEQKVDDIVEAVKTEVAIHRRESRNNNNDHQ